MRRPVSAVNIEQPEFFKAVDAAFSSDLAGRLEDVSALAPDPFRGAGAFREIRARRTLISTGARSPGPRKCSRGGAAAWNRPTARWARRLGQYYVQRNFPPEAKAKAIVMVKNLIDALCTPIFRRSIG